MNFSYEIACLPSRYQYAGIGTIKTAQKTAKPQALIFPDEGWKGDEEFGLLIARYVDGKMSVEIRRGFSSRPLAAARAKLIGAELNG